MAILFSPVITGDQKLDRIQQNVSNSFNTLTGPFLGGNLLSSVAVGTVSTSIKHGLGRVPIVWVLCDQNTNTTVWRLSWDSNVINLEAATACTVSLWVN